MDYTFIVGTICGATIVLLAEAILILGAVFKGFKDGLDEASKSDSEEI